MNALANETVGEYVNENFVTAYQKVGTFRFNPRNGQKQGGNVAAYFCAPDGRVLHCVAGPVDAGTFLREARWTVETARAAIKDSTGKDGKVPIDRLAVLGPADPDEASDAAVKLLDGAADVWNAGKALCAALGKGTDLRVQARCASRPGGAWFVPVDDGVDICNPANAPALGPRGKAKAKGKRRTSGPGAEPPPIADID